MADIRIMDKRRTAEIKNLGTTSSFWDRRLGSYKYISSTYVGGFRPGVFRINPVILRHRTQEGGYGRILSKKNGVGSIGDIGVLIPQCIQYDESTSNNLDNYALQKAYNKLYSAEVQAGVFLGELEETIRLLTNPLEAFSRFAWQNFAKKTRSVTLTSDLWLQYRYGIMPLIGDVTDAIKRVQSKAEEIDGRILSVRGGASNSTTIVYDNTVASTMSANIALKARSTMEVERSSTAIIYYRLVAPKGWREAWGLSISDIPNVAWELIPFSFVVDWFLSVGNWLTSLKSFSNATVQTLGNCVTQTVHSTNKTVYNSLRIWVNNGYVEPDDGAYVDDFITEQRYMARRINLQLPAMPAINPNPYNYKRVLDSLALTWGRLKLRRL